MSNWLSRAGKMSNDDEAAVLALAQLIKEYAPNRMAPRPTDEETRVPFNARLAGHVPSIP